MVYNLSDWTLPWLISKGLFLFFFFFLQTILWVLSSLIGNMVLWVIWGMFGRMLEWGKTYPWFVLSMDLKVLVNMSQLFCSLSNIRKNTDQLQIPSFFCSVRWQTGSSWIPKVDFPSSLPLLGSPNSRSPHWLDSFQRQITDTSLMWSGEWQHRLPLSIFTLSNLYRVHASSYCQIDWTTCSRCKLNHCLLLALSLHTPKKHKRRKMVWLYCSLVSCKLLKIFCLFEFKRRTKKNRLVYITIVWVLGFSRLLKVNL